MILGERGKKQVCSLISVCLSVCLCLSVYLPVYNSICSRVDLSVCLSIAVFLSLSLPIFHTKSIAFNYTRSNVKFGDEGGKYAHSGPFQGLLRLLLGQKKL